MILFCMLCGSEEGNLNPGAQNWNNNKKKNVHSFMLKEIIFFRFGKKQQIFL